jgi:hypothetical protein
MLTITGTVAFALILLTGPYRTVQRRWRTLAPPFIPVRAHANISVLALVAVLLHAGLKLGSIGASLTWLAFLMFVAAFGSGLYGFYMTSAPSRRRAWLTFHRRWTTVFYAVIAWHVLTESLGLSAIVLVLGGALFWRHRTHANMRLAALNWPFRRKPRVHRQSNP